MEAALLIFTRRDRMLRCEDVRQANIHCGCAGYDQQLRMLEVTDHPHIRLQTLTADREMTRIR
jgi:hypothetical protein